MAGTWGCQDSTGCSPSFQRGGLTPAAENEAADVLRVERVGQKPCCTAGCRRGSDGEEPEMRVKCLQVVLGLRLMPRHDVPT